jgi:hypothetical protein
VRDTFFLTRERKYIFNNKNKYKKIVWTLATTRKNTLENINPKICMHLKKNKMKICMYP